MIKRLERLKNAVNIWPTYDLSVRTEFGRKSTTMCNGRVPSLEHAVHCSERNIIQWSASLLTDILNCYRTEELSSGIRRRVVW
jgi:hypothetical protein